MKDARVLLPQSKMIFMSWEKDLDVDFHMLYIRVEDKVIGVIWNYIRSRKKRSLMRRSNNVGYSTEL